MKLSVISSGPKQWSALARAHRHPEDLALGELRGHHLHTSLAPRFDGPDLVGNRGVEKSIGSIDKFRSVTGQSNQEDSA